MEEEIEIVIEGVVGKLSKEQTIDLIILQMFAKSISLDNIMARIKEKQGLVIADVNEELRKTIGSK